MKQPRPRKITARPLLLLLAFCLAGLPRAASAQEPYTAPYTGDRRFEAGDVVEATYAGSWQKARVVGVDLDGGKYQIHFEGEKYCNDHALDSWLSKQYVRPRGEAGGAGAPAHRSSPGGAPANRPGGAPFEAGERVLYRGGGPLWHSGAEVVSYDAEARQYRLRLEGGSGDIVPCHSVVRPGRFDNDFFVGNWAVFVSGATSTFERGGDLYRRYSGGTRLPPLEIRADGTYVWRDAGGKVIRGAWEPREGVPGITLLKGPDGLDWTVYENTEGHAPTAKTLDEIRFHHLPTSTGYYLAYRVGDNKSCVLAGRSFGR